MADGVICYAGAARH